MHCTTVTLVTFEALLSHLWPLAAVRGSSNYISIFAESLNGQCCSRVPLGPSECPKGGKKITFFSSINVTHCLCCCYHDSPKDLQQLGVIHFPQAPSTASFFLPHSSFSFFFILLAPPLLTSGSLYWLYILFCFLHGLLPELL